VPRYVLAPDARDDLQEIRDDISVQGGRRLARYVLEQFVEAFRVLAAHPEIGHLRQDLTGLPVKFWPVFTYLIVYDPAAQPVAIVRVLHSSRDVEAVLGRTGRR